MTVLVSGSLAYDRIMPFAGYFKDNILPDKIHNLNVSFFVQDLQESFGGTAGNIAYNLALLGQSAALLANVGSKDFDPYRIWLKKNKIDFTQVKILKNQQTASAYIITDKADNQISGFFPGAMRQPYQLQANKLQANIAIVSPQNPSDMVKLPKIFKARKIPYIFDPGQQITSLTKSGLISGIAGSKILIGNDYEIDLIIKKTGWSMAALLGASETVVTTLGSKGSIIRQGKAIHRIPPAKPKDILDPTGAGDAYRAGLIYGLLKGWPLPKIGRLAGLVAVYTVEKYGTQTHHFSWSQLAKRYRQNFKDKL